MPKTSVTSWTTEPTGPGTISSSELTGSFQDANGTKCAKIWNSVHFAKTQINPFGPVMPTKPETPTQRKTSHPKATVMPSMPETSAAPTSTARSSIPALGVAARTHSSCGATATSPQQHPPLPERTHQGATKTAVDTPVSPARLASLLEGYINKDYIIRGITEGFMLHFQGQQQPLSSRNSYSVTQNSQIVKQKLQTELALGRIAGPFSKPPFPNFKSSPLALREKSTPGKYRLLHNLSYPYDSSSVNHNIPRTQSSVQYQNIQDAISLLQQHAPSAFMTKTDIADAFRIIPVHPSQYHLLGFSFEGSFYYEKMLSMGAATSCRIFEDFSDALVWILQTKYNISSVVKVLDDFLFIHQDRDTCQQYLQTFLELASYLGVPIAHHKTEGPSNLITFLGIQLDSINMEARLPPEKLSAYSQEIVHLSSAPTTTLRTLKSIIGKLTFTTSVIPSGRAFLRRLHNLTIGHTNPNATITLGPSSKLDLNMWATFLDQHNGRTFISPLSQVTSQEIALCADASKTGFGATYGKSWIQGYWPQSWQKLHISFLELYPIYITIAMFAHKLRHSSINFFSDNMGVVQIINKQSSKCNYIMQVLRPLVLILLHYNITLRSSHIPGIQNILCDAISRQQVTPSLLRQYGAHQLPTPIPQHLRPANFRLNLTTS